MEEELELECTRCKGVFPTSLFTRDRIRTRGWTSRCKKCIKEVKEEYDAKVAFEKALFDAKRNKLK